MREGLQPGAGLQVQRLEFIGIDIEAIGLPHEVADGRNAVIQGESLDVITWALKEQVGNGLEWLGMGLGKGFRQFVTGGGDALGADVVAEPGGTPVADEIPDEAAKAMAFDLNGAGRSPDVVQAVGAVVVPAEECVEPCDMIHVEVRKQQVIDLAGFGEAEL